MKDKVSIRKALAPLKKYINALDKRMKRNRFLTYMDFILYDVHKLRINEYFMVDLCNLLDKYKVK